MAERLGGGHVLGIDRSQKMVDAAAKRNAEHVDAGRATLDQTTLEDAQLPEGSIDKAFAFHVAALWNRPAETLPVIRRALASDGALYLFNQLAGGGAISAARSFAERVAGVLEEHKFGVEELLTEEMELSPVACLIARTS